MGTRVHHFTLAVAIVQIIIVLIETFGWPFGIPTFIIKNADQLLLLRRYQGMFLIVAHLIEKQFQRFNLASIPGTISSLFLFFAFYFPQQPTMLKTLFNFGRLFMVIHIFMIFHFSFYDLIPPKGRYKVGFRRVKCEDLLFAVYYPSEKTSSDKPAFLRDPYALQKFYEANRGPKHMMLLNKISTDFLSKYYINASQHVPLAPPKDEASKKYIPVIVSHGIGANTTTYASLCTNLASMGYIVFAIEHFDDYHGVFSKNSPQVKFECLEKRVQDCLKARKVMEDKAALKAIFGTDVNFDCSKLTVIGHSYGGSTAVELAKKDERIKHIVLLDPWLLPVKEETLQQGFKNGVGLLLQSESWDGKNPQFEIGKRNKTYVDASKSTGSAVMYSIIKNSDHLSFADSALLRVRLLSYRGALQHPALAESIANTALDMILSYMSIFVEKGEAEPRLSSKVDAFKASNPSKFISFKN